MKVKKIGILTSGGDAPGMNPAIYGAVKAAHALGIEIVGFERGYEGILNRKIKKLDITKITDLMSKGGTYLRSARSVEYNSEAGVKKAARICREEGIDAIIVAGGDGSFRGALDISKEGINVVGIPATIDNDIGCSEYSLGFDTSVNTVIDAIDKISDTANSHDKCCVVEVMGRGAGYIAAYAAIATGADVVIIPEEEFDVQESLIKPLLKVKESGKNYSIVIVAEGVATANEIGDLIRENTDLDVRTITLGHIQRGGSPTANDRVYGCMMGAMAVELLALGKTNRVLCIKQGRVTDIDMYEALKEKKDVDRALIRIAKF